MPRRPIGEKAMTTAERQRRHRDIVTNPPMTKAERDDLHRLIRNREKVLKAAASQRSAELIAEFEQQIASIYEYDQDEIWHQAHNAAEEVVANTRKVIADRCVELGRVAKSRVEALEKEALTKIEMHSLEVSTQVLAAGLTSAAAREFLDRLPSIEQLMPPVELGQVRAMLTPRAIGSPHRYYPDGQRYMPEPSREDGAIMTARP